MEQWLAETVKGEDYRCWQGLKEEAGNGDRAEDMYKAVMRTRRPRTPRTNEQEGECQVGWGAKRGASGVRFPTKKHRMLCKNPACAPRTHVSAALSVSPASDCRSVACIIVPIIVSFAKD